MTTDHDPCSPVNGCTAGQWALRCASCRGNATGVEARAHAGMRMRENWRSARDGGCRLTRDNARDQGECYRYVGFETMRFAARGTGRV